MSKKINIMLSTNPTGLGGVATVVGYYKKYNSLTNVEFKYISTHSSYNETHISSILTYLKGIFLVCLYGVVYQLGVVHIHMASRGSYTRKSIIVRLANKLGAKVIIHLHGAEFKKFYSDECSVAKQQHITYTFNLADKVIVLSTQWKEWVSELMEDKNKVCVVYNAVPEVSLPLKNDKKDVILFLGRLGKRKGVDDLIAAFAKIANEFPNCRLDLGGDGDLAIYKKQVVSLGIEKQVRFLGWIVGETKNQCLANATIYCLPSYNEGFPMGVLEAMSSGIAVVSSKAGGIPDAILDQKEGLLIDAGNIDALSDALALMLDNAEVRNQYALAAKEKYLNNFSPEVIIPQLQNIYRELLESQE